MTWVLGGLAVWIVGGLIGSRIMLFALQDEHGAMKTYEAPTRYGAKYTKSYERSGWPLAVGVLWPIMLIFSPIVTAVWLILWTAGRIGNGLLALGEKPWTWWYTKPAVRKAQGHAQKHAPKGGKKHGGKK